MSDTDTQTNSPNKSKNTTVNNGSTSKTRYQNINDDNLRFEITGVPPRLFSDIYYYLLAASWSQLLVIAFVSYIVINILFALLFWLDTDGITGAEPGALGDALFFSVQTFSTIGYGAMSPASLYTHTLVTIESFLGLICVAMVTGIIFAKFSRPSARIAYSQKMIVNSYNGIPTLQFRIANERRNQIINARISVSVLVDEVTAEGKTMRRFYPLKLERADSPLFAISWQVIHPLDETSPLCNITPDTIHDHMNLIVSSFEGLDATFLQTVQARHFYRPADIEFNAHFVDMIEHKENGMLVIHHENLSEVEGYD